MFSKELIKAWAKYWGVSKEEVIEKCKQENFTPEKLAKVLKQNNVTEKEYIEIAKSIKDIIKEIPKVGYIDDEGYTVLPEDG
jgi:Zn-dependent peptidase ImmA (M78 family)